MAETPIFEVVQTSLIQDFVGPALSFLSPQDVYILSEIQIYVSILGIKQFIIFFLLEI